MPREPRATTQTLTDELETQTTAADEPWRDQTIPTFDEPTNGHVPEGVRPSERCGTPSGLGIGCTFKDEHAGRHSWQPEAAEVTADRMDRLDGSFTSAGPIFGEQAQLPGTPEPETNEYTVPTEASFGGKDLVKSAGIQAIAERLIAEDESLEHLLDTDIRYCWRRRGGTQGGRPRYAKIKRPSVWEKFFSHGGPVFLLELAADHIREAKFTETQLQACIYRELCRTDVDHDDHDAYRINAPDFSGFVRELDRFGAWDQDLREMHAHVAKLPLEQAIDEAADSDADEGEESE